MTTPESLSLMLALADSATVLGDVQVLIVDEWHELLGNKRGTQVLLALARLRRWNPRLRAWGLSATLGNLEQACAALAPSRSQRVTRPPEASIRCAMAKPRPVAPPVMTAWRPLRSSWFIS